MRLFGLSPVLCDPVSAILGGVSAGTNLIGGIFGANAAGTAAKEQATQAQNAANLVQNATVNANPGEVKAAQDASDADKAAAQSASDKAVSTAATGAGAVSNAGQQAGAGAEAAATGANDALAPYSTAGATAADVLNKGVAAGGQFNKDFTSADFTADPGYAFREQQGEEALNRNAAATGGLGSGGYLKDLVGYSQGQASQEFQAAFNRYQTERQNQFNDVNAVANAGQAAATTQGKNSIDAAQYAGNTNLAGQEFGANLKENADQFGGNLTTSAAEQGGNLTTNEANITGQQSIDSAKTAGEYLTQKGNAQAAGTVGSANALWGGIGGAANTALTTSLFARPSQNYFSTPSFVPTSYGAAPPLDVAPPPMH